MVTYLIGTSVAVVHAAQRPAKNCKKMQCIHIQLAILRLVPVMITDIKSSQSVEHAASDEQRYACMIIIIISMHYAARAQ